MNWEEIILRYRLQVDDGSELSDDEELSLLNQVYRVIQRNRAWEWLKEVFTGTTSNSVPYVTLPTNFRNFTPNYRMYDGLSFGNTWVPVGYTGDGYSPNVSNASSSVVFVGTHRTPYHIIPFSQRNNVYNTDGFCYVHSGKLYFTKQPTTAQTIEFDYIMKAPDITVSTEPLFSDSYHEMIAYWMASDFNAIEQTNKAESYSSENERKFRDYLSDLAIEDANIKLSLS